MRGRKPVPTELKKQRGTDRPDRGVDNEAQFPIPSRMYSPPENLNEWGEKAWRYYGKLLLDAGLFTDADRMAMELLCQSYGRWIEAERNVALTGTVLTSDRGNFYTNPYLHVANKAWDQIKRMLAEFGLTPAERTRVAALAGDKEEDLATLLFSGIESE